MSSASTSRHQRQRSADHQRASGHLGGSARRRCAARSRARSPARPRSRSSRTARNPPTVANAPARRIEEHRQRRRRTTRRARRTANTRAAASRLMPRALGEQFTRRCATPAPAHHRRQRTPARPASTSEQQRRHRPQRAAEPQHLAAARRRGRSPTPFIAFLLPVNHATQRNSWPEASPRRELDRRLAGGLGQVLGHAAHALRQHHPRDRERRPPAAARRADSSRNPAICVASPTASMRAMPKRVASQPPTRFAPNAGRLVQQEQEGERERRVAEPVEMQQHQHAQRAVGRA